MSTEKLKVQLADKERSLQTLQVLRGSAADTSQAQPLGGLGGGLSGLGGGLSGLGGGALGGALGGVQDDATRCLIEETETLHRALRDIAQTVMAGEETARALVDEVAEREELSAQGSSLRPTSVTSFALGTHTSL